MKRPLGPWYGQRLVQKMRFRAARCLISTPFGWNRGFCLTARTYRPDKGRKRVVPDSQAPQISSHLRQVILPDTWRGRRAAEEAKRFWIKTINVRDGKEQAKKSPQPKKPFLLLIDDRPIAKVTATRSYGIVFSKKDELGQKLWKMAHSIPWSKKSRWIRWPIYLFTGLYSLVFLLWFFCGERVPITGRRQFRCLPLQSPPSKGNPLEVLCDEHIMKILLAENEPRVVRIRSILDRVLLACGLDHLEWTLIVLDTPGEYCLARAPSLMHASPGNLAALRH